MSPHTKGQLSRLTDVPQRRCGRLPSWVSLAGPFCAPSSIPIRYRNFSLPDNLSIVLVGPLMDWVRNKRMLFLLGILAMRASTLLLFLGTHVAIAARALQGLSAKLVWVSGFTFLRSHVDAKNLEWVMRSTYVALGAGKPLGPIVRGAMYEYASQFAVLGIICALVGVDMVLRVMLVDKIPQQDADTSPKEGEETCPLLQDRLEEVQSTLNGPQD